MANKTVRYSIGFSVLSWLLSTSLFATGCALALTLAAEKLLTHGTMLPLLSPLHLLVGGSTLLEYNIHFLWNAKARSGEKITLPYGRLWHPVFCIAGLILCIVSLPGLNDKLLGWTIVLGLAAMLYSAPSLPFRPKRKINDYGITKILVLTATWVIVTTIFPAAYLGLPLSSALPEIVVRTALIFPLCLAFDQRDVITDRLSGIQTLAGSLGESATYLLMYCILGLLAGAAVYYCISGRSASFSSGRIVAIIIAAVAAIVAIRHSRRNPHPFVYAGLIDGVMLLYGLLGIFLQ